ncbi:putative repeat protein (TIGR03803 family) [Natronocella acetinitrilica]|uniref:Repeat protein (TIGR03803 family) n=1 Tax=Natronocella acetinitrilica TaxID=414046 RepID=A0AAE3G8I0_9GAMM|nr:choice-of-anchor tandem repeat GloVer-containing protein [Natronocella acetinitrilica]MCP1676973.1 putative repeat protein (TIGR03803 family) [Natronocella acetinitrilica]
MRSPAIYLALSSLLLLVPPASSAQIVLSEILHQFDGQDGTAPVGRLTEGTDGFLYGVTSAGGADNCGSVFRISLDGQFDANWRINLIRAQTGCEPQMGLTAIPGENAFFGTAREGGANGNGTIFRVTQNGTITTAHHFGTLDSPRSPGGALLLASDGNWYGTSTGTSLPHPTINGTIFRYDGKDTVTILHEQDSDLHGRGTEGGLIQGEDGHLYGVARFAGQHGDGTLFRVTLGGDFTVLHHFKRDVTGRSPSAPLALGPDGAIYGVAPFDGPQSSGAFGTLFRYTSSEGLELLHEFVSIGFTPVVTPQRGVVFDQDGTLYGTAFRIYRRTPNGEVEGLGPPLSIGTKSVMLTSNGDLFALTEGNLVGQTDHGTIFVYWLSAAANGTPNQQDPDGDSGTNGDQNGGTDTGDDDSESSGGGGGGGSGGGCSLASGQDHVLSLLFLLALAGLGMRGYPRRARTSG